MKKIIIFLIAALAFSVLVGEAATPRKKRSGAKTATTAPAPKRPEGRKLTGDSLIRTQDDKVELYGFKSRLNSSWVISPQYDFAIEFHDNLAWVSQDENNRFVINLRGERVSPIFKYLVYLEDYKIYYGENESGYQLLNYRFEPINGVTYRYLIILESIPAFLVRKGQNYGIINALGEEIVPIEYEELSVPAKYISKTNDYAYDILESQLQNDGLDTESSRSAVILARKDGKWGAIDLANNVLLPFKSKTISKVPLKKNYKKILRQHYLQCADIAKPYIEAVQTYINLNQQYLADYPSYIFMYNDVTLKKNKNGYSFYDGTFKVGDSYTKATEYKNDRGCLAYIVSRGKKYGMVNRFGEVVVPLSYNIIEPWYPESGAGNYYFRARDSHGDYILDHNGRRIFNENFDKISDPQSIYAIGIRDGKYWLLNAYSGKIAINTFYDNIEIDEHFNAYGYNDGYKISIDGIRGKEVNPISDQIYEEANRIQQSDPQGAIALYEKAFALGKTDAANKIKIIKNRIAQKQNQTPTAASNTYYATNGGSNSYVQCPKCKGTGVCVVCHGTGRGPNINVQLNAGVIMGNQLPCALCGGNPTCQLCAGAGQITQAQYDGYEEYCRQMLATGAYSSGSSSSYSTSSSSSTPSNQASICKKCHGTGVDPSPVDVDSDHFSGYQSWAAYYHSGGAGCPHCSLLNPHWHQKCGICNIPRY